MKKLKLKKTILIFISVLLFSFDVYISKDTAIYSFEQCLYQLMKLEGASASPIITALFYIIIYVLIFGLIFYLPIIDFGKKVIVKIKKKDIQLYPIKNLKGYGIILLSIGILYLAKQVVLFPYIKNTIFSSTDIFDEYYTDTSKVQISFPDKKQNLIYIFVESLETSGMSRENGGEFKESIIPHLEELAQENVNFSNSDMLGGAQFSYGTNWTASAMIAHTSGIPVKVMLKDFQSNSTRFGNIKTLGDILAENGYSNYLLLGSNADFGGRRAYFANHNYSIYDYYTAIKDKKIDSDYYEWWGYEDAKLFDIAKEELTKISEKKEPFNFTILTADTHFTDGYLDESCENPFDSHYANAFYCSDGKLNDFVTWIKEQDFYQNTTIVIVGDHHTMQNNFYKEQDYVRTVYNVFINSRYNGYFENKNRIFTTLDLFPTTLASLGADISGDRLGLGTNLYSDKKTIPELIGLDVFNEELSKSSTYYYDVIRK